MVTPSRTHRADEFLPYGVKRAPMVRALCVTHGFYLPLAFRAKDHEEQTRFDVARTEGLAQIPVVRRCPLCMAEHVFDIPLPSKGVLIHVQRDPECTPQLLRPVFKYEVTLKTALTQLHDDYWYCEKLVGACDPAKAKEALELLPSVLTRYDGLGRSRAVAATRVLLAVAHEILGDLSKSQQELTKALSNLDPELDRHTLRTAHLLRERLGVVL